MNRARTWRTRAAVGLLVLASLGTTAVLAQAEPGEGDYGYGGYGGEDTTPPTITCPSPIPTLLRDQPGWIIADVTDAESGPTSPVASVQADTSTRTRKGTTRFADLSASDNAGNVGNASCEYKVGLDRTPPVVTCPAPPEFVRGTVADVVATVTDSESGPAAPTVSAAANTATRTLKNMPRTVMLVGLDNAGNVGFAVCTYTVVSGRDRTPPTVTCVPDQSFARKAVGEVLATVTDADSGPATPFASAPADTLTRTRPGHPRTVLVTGADNAGNTASALCEYIVFPPPPT